MKTLTFSKWALPCLLCALAMSSNAQDNYINTTISVPPSPTAANLGKYGEVPVSLYTGVPNISVPLYSMSDGNLSLGVSLSYHSQGFKTEEIASNVGLGWSLNAGGIITRAVRGVPDDFNGDLWGSDSPSPVNNYCAGGSQLSGNLDCTFPSYGYLSTGNDIETNNLNPAGADYEELSKNIKDGEQDIFYFNFDGHSGQFIFNKDGVPKFFSKQNLDVSYTRDTNGDIIKFQVIDGNGTIYYFEDYEVTNTAYSRFSTQDFTPGYNGNQNYNTDESDNSFFYAGTNLSPFVSAWHLTRIKSFTGTHEIKFVYSSELQQYKNSFSQQYSAGPTMNNFSSSVTFNSISTKKIYSISWEQGKILFSYAHERQDIGCNLRGGVSYTPNYALTHISILDLNNQLIKKYVLDYNYFGLMPFANASQNNGSNFDCNYRKLKLLSVQEFNSLQTESKPPYLFDYNTSSALAPTFTAKRDLWGYQKNTAPLSGQSRIPKIYYHGVNDNYSKSNYAVIPYKTYSWTWGAYDISPEAAGQTAFLLTKITYPTKGYTSFEYEPHQFNLLGVNRIGGGARIKKMTDSDGLGADIIKNYIYTDETNSSLSSGVLMSLPTYVKKAVSCGTNNYECTIFTRSISGLGSTFGSTVGYKRVVVEYNGNGKTESLFNTQGGIGAASEECASTCLYTSTGSAFVDNGYCNEDHFPYADNPNFDWYRGVLNEERVYNNSNQLLKKTVNEYTVKNFEKLKCIKAGIYNGATTTNAQVTKYASYYMLSGWKVLSKQVTTEYDVSNAGRQLQTVVNYYFDNSDHMQLTKTTAADSKGRVTETIFRRSKDYTGPGTILSALNSQHRWNEVLEKQVWLTGSPKILIGAEFTSYTDFAPITGNAISQLLPSKSYALETSTPITSTAFNDTYFNTNPVLDNRFKLVAEYNFDAKDNLSRSSIVNSGLKNHSATIWGHGKSIMIAKVENAIEAECGFTSFESDDRNLWENAGSQNYSADAHCGTNSCNLAPSGVVARNFLMPLAGQDKKFILSCWVKTTSSSPLKVGKLVLHTIQNNGSNQQYPGDAEAYRELAFGNTNGAWQYLEIELDVARAKLISGIQLPADLGLRAYVVNSNTTTPILVDDIRFYPKQARMTTVTYIPLIGVSSTSDENNNCLFYEYDAFGRLKLTRDQNQKILEKTDYNYKP